MLLRGYLADFVKVLRNTWFSSDETRLRADEEKASQLYTTLQPLLPRQYIAATEGMRPRSFTLVC